MHWTSKQGTKVEAEDLSQKPSKPTRGEAVLGTKRQRGGGEGEFAICLGSLVKGLLYGVQIPPGAVDLSS